MHQARSAGQAAAEREGQPGEACLGSVGNLGGPPLSRAVPLIEVFENGQLRGRSGPRQCACWPTVVVAVAEGARLVASRASPPTSESSNDTCAWNRSYRVLYPKR